jgi:hypothetical protein
MDVDYDKRRELKLTISPSMDLSLGTTAVLPEPQDHASC